MTKYVNDDLKRIADSLEQIDLKTVSDSIKRIADALEKPKPDWLTDAELRCNEPSQDFVNYLLKDKNQVFTSLILFYKMHF